MTTPDVIVPIVHSNGTSAQQLLELRETAYAALDSAALALRQMAPNGRDYYPEPGRMTKADDQHMRRLKAVRDLMDEIETECTALLAQGR